ncbi:pyridoxal phosphate-dependent aminotransferase, partial [Thermodesulfobacteriota bacterium]
KIPLMKDYSVDIAGFLKDSDSCGLIFANPNAPTGIFLPLKKIELLLENYPSDRVVIIDEAYVDFGGDSALEFLDRYENLVIIRTFSKSMSLAGIRLGYVISGKKSTDALFTVKDSFNSYPVDILSQIMGEIAISDTDYYKVIIEKVVSTREYLSFALREIGWNVLPSKANFIFASREGLTGREIYLKLKEKGILVRYFDIDGIKNFVRISIGTREDMEHLLTQIKETF